MRMFPEVTISGAPRERGRQYGSRTAPLIRHSIASYARLFAYRRGVDWATIQRSAQDYAVVLADLAPELLEEMRGIAEGAEVSLNEIVALNARTELLSSPRTGMAHPNYDEATAHNRTAGVPQHSDDTNHALISNLQSPISNPQPPDTGECTTVAALPAATKNGGTLLAQNWDWTGDQRAACIMLRVRAPGKPDILTMTEAGIVAKIGLNSEGLGVSLNILQSHDDGKTSGMPVHVLLRLLLELTRVEEALAYVERVRAAASSCITVADAGGNAVAFELTPNGTGVIEPCAGLLIHTNHCVDPHILAGAYPLDPLSSSVPRYDRAAALMEAASPNVDLDTTIAVLRDLEGGANCICRRPDPRLHPCERVESVCGIAMELDVRVMHIAPEVPCEVEFSPISVL
jgi:isopenicillin-N N-acyltransferase-like protein